MRVFQGTEPSARVGDASGQCLVSSHQKSAGGEKDDREGPVFQVRDFHRVREGGKLLHLDGDVEFSPRRSLLAGV